FRESNQPGTASFTANTTTANTTTANTTTANTTTSPDTDTLNQTISAINDTGTGYILQKNIDIIKNGTYAFDFQFYNNDTGTLEDKPIKLIIDGVERDYQSLSGNDSNLDSNLNSSSYNTFSIVSTAYLQKGTHNIELTVPDSKAKLDFALVYTINSKNADSNNMYDSNHNISSLPFSDQNKPAYLSDNSKINPTKHVVRIDNATKPFVLLFSETYDPLWTASIVGDGDSDNATNGNNGDQQSAKTIANVPLFSIVNGFLINKTGSFDVVIEYKPQAWFFTGLSISIIIVILFAVTMMIYYYKINKSKHR
ncbi:MAG TPA: hypothetical protein VFV86_00995, partial [Nitrososphaeraceae archaeon]|nr:hypothetical protein [Nitrososphaeraceae archaeon]